MFVPWKKQGEVKGVFIVSVNINVLLNLKAKITFFIIGVFLFFALKITAQSGSLFIYFHVMDCKCFLGYRNIPLTF